MTDKLKVPKMSIDGDYEIVEMEQWGKEDIDLVEPGYIRINGNRGTLHFICVDGDMDIRKVKSGGYKFSWDGNDEYDPAAVSASSPVTVIY